jgi:hypothetical protein
MYQKNIRKRNSKPRKNLNKLESMNNKDNVMAFLKDTANIKQLLVI